MNDGNVRFDIGGWISGPCLDPAQVRAVPPGSAPLRELAHAVVDALTLPGPATQRDELTYLRIIRDRSRLVLVACRKIIADREIEDDDWDLIAVVTALRDDAAQLPDDSYDHRPEPS